MNSGVWVDKQGGRWQFALHGPVSLAVLCGRRAYKWTLTLASARGRCKELFVELGSSLFKDLDLAAPRRQTEFRKHLLGAAKRALFMGRLGDSETVDLDGSPDNVLRLYYAPRNCVASELATARFGFELDECYEADLISYVRGAIYKALSPKQLSGVAYPDLLEAAGIEEDVFGRVLDDMIVNGLVTREQLTGAAPELFRITTAGISDASTTAIPPARSPVGSRTRDWQSGVDVRPSLDGLIGKLKRNDEHLDVEAKEAFFANTKHRDAKPGSPKPNDDNALRGMLKALVAFANTFGGNFVVGLENRTWEPVGIDDTDLVLCGDWDEFKRRFNRRVSDETKGIAPAPEIRREICRDRTFAIVSVRQLPESCFRNRTLAYMKQVGRCYIRTNGDSVPLELSDIATHCDAILEGGRQGPESVPSANVGSPTDTSFTKQETELLAAAVQDEEIYLCEHPLFPAGWVKVGMRHFRDSADPSVAVQYVEALESLVSRGYARHAEGMLYVLTGNGLSAARGIAGQQ